MRGIVSTQTKSGKTGIFGVVALVIAAGLIWVVFEGPGRGPKDPSEDLTEKVNLLVTFTPTIRQLSFDSEVKLHVSCDCTLIIKKDLLKSPWREQVVIPKGAKLLLTATQISPGRLTCKIGAQEHEVLGPGGVMCTHNQ